MMAVFHLVFGTIRYQKESAAITTEECPIIVFIRKKTEPINQSPMALI